MAKNIDPKLKRIGDYLKLDDNSMFLIPEYQRAYSWGIKHCDKLWQDIDAFIESGGSDPYFFGTIIINCQENDSVLSLIDGQQRTTTFLLLFKALLIRLDYAITETDGDDDSRRLNKALQSKRDNILKILYKATDEEIFDIVEDFSKAKGDKVLENLSNNELYKTDLVNILRASDYTSAESAVTKIPYKQKDNKYTNYFRNFKFFCEKLRELPSTKVNVFAENILDKCEIIEIRSWNVDQAITMFNSLNSDGMPLLDADIISAQLYKEAGSSKENFNDKWRSLLSNVSELEQYRIVDIDTIIMQYMYIVRARTKEYITDTGSINVTTPGLRRYFTEINKSLFKEPISLCDELLKISKTWLRIKDYPIIKLIFKFNENIKLFLAGYLSRFELDEITETAITPMCESLLQLFTVLELVDTGYSSSRFKTFLFGENIKLVDKGIGVEELARDFNQHIAQTWKRDDLVKEIQEYDKNILVHLNEYLFAKSQGVDFVYTEKYDIEHIMPASGKNISQIRIDAGIDSDEIFSSVVNKLGNKLLLEEDINRSIGNEWFRTKIQTSVSDKSGYKDSKFAVASALVEKYKGVFKPYWLKEDIDIATVEVANRIADFIFPQ
jgi:hypothetical protein